MAAPGSMRDADPGSSCPVAPGSLVRTYQMAREFEWWCHLCPFHLREMKAANWQVKVNRTPPFVLVCDEWGDGRCGK